MIFYFDCFHTLFSSTFHSNFYILAGIGITYEEWFVRLKFPDYEKYSTWEEVTLKELVELKQGFALNKKSKHYIVEKRGIALLKISDLFKNTETLFVSENIPKQFLVYEDEIIYTRTAQVGYAFMGKRGVIYNNCFKVIPNEKKIDKLFLFYFLNHKHTRILAQALATGTAQQDLNHEAFKSIKINLPPLEMQKKISIIISKYNEKIKNNNQQIKLLKETRDILLPQLISGKLDVDTL